MYRFLYSIAFHLIVPFALLRLVYRSKKEPLYRAHVGERFGFAKEPAASGKRIWVHAVSAGETNAAAPLIERFLRQGYDVVVTNMTPTGRQRVAAHFDRRVHNFYAPYDLPGAIDRFLKRVAPDALVIVDTEMWPNMIARSKAHGLDIFLVNARLSEKSANGYRRIATLTKEMLKAFTSVAVQTESHAERFLQLGLKNSQLAVTGSIKFDVSLPEDMEAKSELIRQRTKARTILLAASTHAGEEEAVIEAFLTLEIKNALLVIAPRHSHRCDAVYSLCEDKGLTVVTHSSGKVCSPDTSVLLLDTMGELMYFYNVAAVAFLGGSLVPVGGHNPMEPASLRVPVIMGPHLRNIEDIAQQFVDEKGMIVVRNQIELTAAISELLTNGVARTDLIDGAERVMARNRGALGRVENLITAKIGLA